MDSSSQRARQRRNLIFLDCFAPCAAVRKSAMHVSSSSLAHAGKLAWSSTLGGRRRLAASHLISRPFAIGSPTVGFRFSHTFPPPMPHTSTFSHLASPFLCCQSTRHDLPTRARNLTAAAPPLKSPFRASRPLVGDGGRDGHRGAHHASHFRAACAARRPYAGRGGAGRGTQPQGVLPRGPRRVHHHDHEDLCARHARQGQVEGRAAQGERTATGSVCPSRLLCWVAHRCP
jgi:hypothetical protein